MRINRTLAALTAAAMILSVTACSNGNSGSSSDVSGSVSSGTAQTTGTAEAAGTAEVPVQTQEQSQAQPVRSVLESETPVETVVAKPTNGAEGMEVTFGDFMREYKYYLVRSGYDNDTDAENAATIATARQQIIDAIIEDRIIRAKFAEYGMTFSDEEEEEIHADVEAGVETIKSTLKSTLASSDDSLSDDELTAKAEEQFQQILTDCGLTMDVLYGWQEVSVMKQKLTAEIGKDATYSYEDAQTQMETVIESLKSQYENSPAEYYGQNYANIWIPEGSRAVKAILVSFDSTVYTLMQQLRSEGRDDDADEYRQEKLADIQQRYDEIMEKISSGEDFDKLMEEYDEDQGNGTFLVTPGTEVFGTEFAECAMGIENAGDVATCVTDFGYYIVKYIDEVTVSDDVLKSSTEDLQAYLLENEKSKLYSAEFDKWKTEYAYETNAEILGLN